MHMYIINDCYCLYIYYLDAIIVQHKKMGLMVVDHHALSALFICLNSLQELLF